MPMLKTLPAVKRQKKLKGLEPKQATVDFLLNFSKSVEVKTSAQIDTMLIHLN